VSYEGDLFEVEKTLIRDVTADHSAVIVGRGAAQTLAGRAGVLAVFVHAPESWRVARVQQVYGITAPDSALTMVRQSDRDRTAFVRALTGADWADHQRYDLVIDTSIAGFDRAVDLVVDAAHARAAVPAETAARRV
jgi:cytidylate kinase